MFARQIPVGARTLLLADAAFLFVMGLFGFVTDLASYGFGVGPFGTTFLGDPRVIGVLEAHGLAAMTGVAGFAALRSARIRYWQVHFAAVHLLLGGANLAFFQLFASVGAYPMGVAVTAIHFLFAAGQLALFIRPQRGAATTGSPSSNRIAAKSSV